MAKRNTISFRVTINGQEVSPHNEKQLDVDNGPKPCPQCGDTIAGESRICPSCDYVSDLNLLEDYYSEVENLISDLKMRIETKQYGEDYHELLAAIDSQIASIRAGYGRNPEINEKLIKYKAEKESLVKKEKRRSFYASIGCAVMIVVMAAILAFFKKYAK